MASEQHQGNRARPTPKPQSKSKQRPGQAFAWRRKKGKKAAGTKDAAPALRKKAPVFRKKTGPAKKRPARKQTAVAEGRTYISPFPAEDRMNNIRYLLGRVVELVQYIEYNLCIALNYAYTMKALKNDYDKKTAVTAQEKARIAAKARELQIAASTMTFGTLIATVSEANISEKEDLDELEAIPQTRNQLVHQFFTKNDFET